MNKIVVVGLGNIANRHRRNIKALFRDATIYAISSSGRLPDEMVSDCDAYLSDVEAAVREGVDLAIIASPSTCHFKHSQRFIAAGIPTLIEKPVTASYEDAAALLEFSSHYQTPVAVGYCLRYLPSAKKLKKIIEDGFIGNIYNVQIDIGQFLPDWRPGKSYRDSVSAIKTLGGGALLELSHELDYAQWIFGEMTLISSVLRSSSELEMDVESLADIMAVNQDGAVINIHLDFLQKKAWRQCHIIGSKGRIVWDLIGNELMYYSAEGVEALYSDPSWDKNQMYLEMLKDFMSKIAGRSNSCIELQSSTNIVNLIKNIKDTSRYYEVNK